MVYYKANFQRSNFSSMRLSVFATFFSLFFSGSLSAQTVWYVRQNATGLQNGSSWEHAFSDLQDATAVARPRDQIWVAAGTYRPVATGADRRTSFTLQKGIRWYGGFAGQETHPDQRTRGAYPTILSGEIGDPTTTADNVYHVLYGNGLDSSTVIDGFTITGGNAKDPNFFNTRVNWGGGALLEGGQDASPGDAVFQYCLFEGNQGDYGGAVYAHWQGQSRVNPLFRHCVFRKNTATYTGAVLYKVGPGVRGGYSMEDCLITENYVVFGGAGVVLSESVKTRNTFKRCIFEQDSVAFSSGFWYRDAGKDSSACLIDSCIFRSLKKREGGRGSSGFEYNAGTSTPGAAFFQCRIQNSIFENMKSNSAAAFSLTGGTLDVEVENCVFRNNGMLYEGPVSIWGTGNVLIRNCYFYNNKEVPQQGLSSGALLIRPRGNMRANVYNCLFANNTRAITIETRATSDKVETNVVHCTFYNHSLSVITKYWDQAYLSPTATGFSRCSLVNCVFADTLAPVRLLQNRINGGIPKSRWEQFYTDYSLLPFPANAIAPAQEFGVNNLYEALPTFMDAINQDFRLAPCSKGIDGGDNRVLAQLSTDLAGLPRLLHGRVDMGAFEQPDTCTAVSVSQPTAAAGAPRLFVLHAPAADEMLRCRVESSAAGTLSVVSLSTGRVLFQSPVSMVPTDTFQVHLPGLVPGVYVVALHASGSVLTGKWVVAHGND